MNKIKVLLVEDAAHVEVALQNRLSDINYEVVNILSSPSLVLDFIKKQKVDVVLMDVFLDESYTGVDAANDIMSTLDTPVILLSGEDNLQYNVLKNSKAYAIMFKPFSDIELMFNVNAAIETGSVSSIAGSEIQDIAKPYIFVRADFRLNKIRVNDIYYIESKKDYVTIHTTDNVYTVHATMKDMIKILPSDLFIRTHRSFIVNIDKIFSIKYPDILIEHKMKTILIGGLYRKELFNRINVI